MGTYVKKHVQASGVDLVDPNGAPTIFFDAAPSVGTTPGIVRITLGARRELMLQGEVSCDLVASAYLRCSVEAAINLREALNTALSMAGVRNLELAQDLGMTAINDL